MHFFDFLKRGPPSATVSQRSREYLTMGCVNAICTGLAALARLVDVETAQLRVCPQPPQTQSCRRLAIPVASVVTSDLRARPEMALRRLLKKSRKWNSSTENRRSCGFPWHYIYTGTLSDPHAPSEPPVRVTDHVWGSSPPRIAHLGDSRRSSTPQTMCSRWRLSSRTALHRATATCPPQSRRGLIRATWTATAPRT